MTSQQKKTIDLLYELGSDPDITYQDGRNYRVALPFTTDLNPNIEVFPDGHYTDYSASPEWEKLGIGKYGDSRDLMKALGTHNILAKQELLLQMKEAWDSLETLEPEEVLKYVGRRKLWGHIRWGYYNTRMFIAFPMWKHGDIVGIQRRFLDGEQPKNMMYRGSDSHGIFRTFESCASALYVMEGATDTATDYTILGNVIGAPSASMLEGVQSYIAEWDQVWPDERIHLCFDNDAAGREATKKMVEYIKEIGHHEIYILNHPPKTKDFNDIIVAGYTYTFSKYEDPIEQITFINFNGEPIDKTAWAWGIPKEFAPNMNKIVCGQAIEVGVSVYVAESVGLQDVYYVAGNNPSNQFIIVRGL